MERYQKVADHKKLHDYLEQIKGLEEQRIFCHHDWEHMLAVARIAYILSMEEGLNISKDWIYAAALLHDIGKKAQYERGIPHEIESAALAEGILMDCGYEAEEIAEITAAIMCHRSYREENNDFQKLLYRADKLSRPCRSCQAAEQCKWPKERKNTGVTV